MGAALHLSVIIPTLNEAATIATCLDQFASWRPAPELIVVDGGSTDATREILAAHPSQPYVVSSDRGRGRQLQRGAAEASGNALLFLHADTLLPPIAHEEIWRTLARKRFGGGFFRLKVEGLEALEAAAVAVQSAWRGRTRTPLGDQAVFCWRFAYDRAGGIRDVALLEDYLFACALRKVTRLREVPLEVTASGRRFHGRFWQQTWQDFVIFTRYRLGTPLTQLRAEYRDDRPGVEPLAPAVASRPSMIPAPPLPSQTVEIAFPTITMDGASLITMESAMPLPAPIAAPVAPMVAEPVVAPSPTPVREEPRTPSPESLAALNVLGHEPVAESLTAPPAPSVKERITTALHSVLFQHNSTSPNDPLDELPPMPESAKVVAVEVPAAPETSAPPLIPQHAIPMTEPALDDRGVGAPVIDLGFLDQLPRAPHAPPAPYEIDAEGPPHVTAAEIDQIRSELSDVHDLPLEDAESAAAWIAQNYPEIASPGGASTVASPRPPVGGTRGRVIEIGVDPKEPGAPA